VPEVSFPHDVNYDYSGSTDLDAVIRSLQAQKEFIKHVAPLFEGLVDGLAVTSISISLERIESGSLKELFVIAAYTQYSAEFNEEGTDLVNALTGVKIPDKYETIFTLAFLLVVLWVATRTLDMFKKKKSDQTAPSSITNSYNTTLNLFAGRLDVEPDDVEGVLSSHLGDTPTADQKKSLSRFVAPFRGKPRRGLRAANGEVELSQDAIDELPSFVDLEHPEPVPHETHHDVTLNILAIDRQKRTSGWACSFASGEYETPRVRLDLLPYIEIGALDVAKVVKCDVAVELKDDKVTPKVVHLVKVHEVIE
jgi:hypothetical protein